MSALFDFPSLLVVILLFVCSMTYLRTLYPSIFSSPDPNNAGQSVVLKSGIKGFCWKASRIGERLSPYVGASCVLMAIHILFFK